MSNVYTTIDPVKIVQQLHANGWITGDLHAKLQLRAQVWVRPDAAETERRRLVTGRARRLVEGDTWPVLVPAEALAFMELHNQGLCSRDEADKWWTDEFLKRARERENRRRAAPE